MPEDPTNSPPTTSDPPPGSGGGTGGGTSSKDMNDAVQGYSDPTATDTTTDMTSIEGSDGGTATATAKTFPADSSDPPPGSGGGTGGGV